MTKRFRQSLIIGLSFWSAVATTSLAGPPDAVSPGSPDRVLAISGLCPTFSWSGSESARFHELVVFELEEEGGEPAEILRLKISGGASTWTPSLDRCLEHSGRYGWSVRSVGERDVSEWSEPSLFEVAAAPSRDEVRQALEVLRLHLEESSGPGPSSGSGFTSPPRRVAGASPEIRTSASAAVPTAGNPLLKVEGSPVVTVATLARALCGSLTYRFVDLLNGTVFDCNTERIWLKDAGCLGNGTWDEAGSVGSVQQKVDQLNAGTDFGCVDYVAGTHQDWRLPAIEEFCATESLVVGDCPAESAPSSLFDTSLVTFPKLLDARGDGSWRDGDAFVSLAPAYWSATTGSLAATSAARSAQQGGGMQMIWIVDDNGILSLNTQSATYPSLWVVRGGSSP